MFVSSLFDSLKFHTDQSFVKKYFKGNTRIITVSNILELGFEFADFDCESNPHSHSTIRTRDGFHVNKITRTAATSGGTHFGGALVATSGFCTILWQWHLAKQPKYP